MSKYRNLLRLFGHERAYLGEEVKLVLNPVDPPKVLRRTNPTRKVFEDAVEQQIDDFTQLSLEYTRVQPRGTKEIPYRNRNPSRHVGESTHPTDVLIALNSNFEAPSIYRATELVHELDVRQQSSIEVLNILAMTINLRKKKLGKSEEFLRGSIFQLEVEMLRKLYLLETYRCNFDMMNRYLWDIVWLYKLTTIEKDTIFLGEYVRWIFELSKVQEIQGNSELALKTLVDVSTDSIFCKVKTVQQQEILTEIFRLRCEVEDHEVCYAILTEESSFPEEPGKRKHDLPKVSQSAS